MDRNQPGFRPRRRGGRAALAVLLLGLMFGLSQCKLVGDTVTGLKAKERKPANCFAECAHQFADSVQAEGRLHSGNVQACAGDEACLATEDARHEAAISRIVRERKDCQAECHHQGGGSGG